MNADFAETGSAPGRQQPVEHGGNLGNDRGGIAPHGIEHDHGVNP